MKIKFFIGENTEKLSNLAITHLMEIKPENPHVSKLIIVPEQYTLQTQRRLVMSHPQKSVMDTDVLNFNRLAFRVFKELGINTLSVLEETGKNLILRRVAEEHEDELCYLKGRIKKMGYIGEIKSLISELSQYGISPQKLKEISELPGMNPMFKSKINDVIILYEGFLNHLSGSFITSEMILDMLKNCVDKSSIVKNSIILFDGYTGFTPVQMEIFERLLCCADTIFVTANMPGFEWESLRHLSKASDVYEEDLYFLPKTMLLKIRGLAAFHGIKIEEPYFESAKGNKPNIKIYENSDILGEVSFAGTMINKLIQRDNLMYRDIAIICANPGEYEPFIKQEFGTLNIPFFIDSDSDITTHPAIEFCFSILDIIIKDFSYSSVFRMLRGGLSGIDSESIDKLDMYISASGIRGKEGFGREFNLLPHGYNEESLYPINNTRQAIVDLLLPFEEELNNIRDYIKALFDVISIVGLYERLKDKEDGSEAVYDLIIDVFDKMEMLLGDTKVSIEEFRELFASGIESSKLAAIPNLYDSIIVGDIERTRLDDIKIMFLLGVNDGKIPNINSAGGILTESERVRLASFDFELSPTLRQRSFIQRYYLDLLLKKPKEKLFVSYCLKDLGGEEIGASYLIGTLKSKYGLSVNKPEYFLWDEKNTKRIFLSLLREYAKGKELSKEDEKLLDELLYYFKKSDESAFHEILSDVFFMHTNAPIRSAVLRALDGGKIGLSVSRIEQYCKCAYAFFLRYVLSLSEKRDSALAAVDMGSLYHSGLEKYSKLLIENNLRWGDISDERSDEILDIAVEEAYEELFSKASYEKAREQFILSNMKDTISTTVWALRQQVKAGSFVPKGFEVTLESLNAKELFEYELSEGSMLKLNGTIDRMDIAENESRIYIKIIDYKSGNMKMDQTKLYHGLQIQLMFYMDAATRSFEKINPKKEVIPAGLFYYHITNPVIEKKKLKGESIEEKLLEELRPDGMLLSLPEVIEAFDDSLGPGIKSKVVPISFKKDGEISSSRGNTKKVLSVEEMNGLRSFVRKKVRDVAEEFARGNIDINPYRIGKDEKGCNYCSYHSICGFEEDLEGYDYRELKKIEDIGEIIGGDKLD